MTISVFHLFTIGIGPSSSHTVGPMRAAEQFVQFLHSEDQFIHAKRVKVDLYGSLALTGEGHGTDLAILMGLEGEIPEGVDPSRIASRVEVIERESVLTLGGKEAIAFERERDLLFHKDKVLPYHSNGMRFTAYDEEGSALSEKVYYSVGGGFVVDHEHAREDDLGDDIPEAPYPFATGEELFGLCKAHGLSVAELVWANERTWRSDEEIREGLLKIWEAMKGCILRGCETEGVLPGGLDVRRRAPEIFQHLTGSKEVMGIDPKAFMTEPTEVMDWVSLWALAVNEENAAGGRVVTAPTNGAAGILPAVLNYYWHFVKEADEEGVLNYLLTCAAIGILYKLGASISAAEMGCQGEVGVACSMAAAGLCAVSGGNLSQVENAAEIGMEHNLGLTCDPVKGLVQIPCIERNTMGSIKAINACRLALRGDGSYKVSLDAVIRTMRQTGIDMRSIYKETSQGGLAVNVIEC